MPLLVTGGPIQSGVGDEPLTLDLSGARGPDGLSTGPLGRALRSRQVRPGPVARSNAAPDRHHHSGHYQ